MANVELPQLGESIEEGVITSWLVEVGDTVEVDQPLVEISTDKVDTEIPSPVAGHRAGAARPRSTTPSRSARSSR